MERMEPPCRRGGSMTLIGKENLCGLLADKALEAQLEDECTELAIAECLSIVRRMP